MSIKTTCGKSGSANNSSVSGTVVTVDDDGGKLDGCVAAACVAATLDPGAVVTLPDNPEAGQSVAIIADATVTVVGGQNPIAGGNKAVVAGTSATFRFSCAGEWVPDCCPVGGTGGGGSFDPADILPVLIEGFTQCDWVVSISGSTVTITKTCEGALSQMGQTTVTENASGTLGSTQLVQGTILFTAEDGSTLSGTTSGLAGSSAIPPVGSSEFFAGDITITGGTGRFAGASGSGYGTCQATIETSGPTGGTASGLCTYFIILNNPPL